MGPDHESLIDASLMDPAMNTTLPSPLFVFEMANNHMGQLEHGKRLIEAIRDVAKPFPYAFAFKLQYRDLDTFIHPAYRGRMDIKYVKRFEETRLSADQYGELVQAMRG